MEENFEDGNETLEYNDNKYLYSWGFGKYGQIGAKFCNYSITPIKQNYDEKEEIFQIAAGESHSAILTLSSKLNLYGKNYFGQLGLSHNNYVYNPTKINILEAIKISKVVCGGDHTITLTEESVVYAWGLNAFGQLGLGDFLARKQPVRVVFKTPNNLNNQNKEIIQKSKSAQNEDILMKNEEVVEIAAGAQHSMILTNKNRIFTCGYAKFNSLGFETEEDTNIFTQVNLTNVKNTINKITCGVYHSACIVDNEAVYIWGRGEALVYETPTLISLEGCISSMPNNPINSSNSKRSNPNIQIRDCKIGEDSLYILSKNDELFAMGDNKYGQMGNKTTASKKLLEKLELPKVKQLEVGYSFVIIVTYDNKVYGWGNNEYGQLCLTESNIILQPTFIEELSNLGVYKISCGGYHSLGLFNKNYDMGQLQNNLNVNENTRIISDLKQNLKICNLNSTIKKDFAGIIEKVKFLENMKSKILELESNIMNKDIVLKDLILKEEELNKKLGEGGKDGTKKHSKFLLDNPRGFDNTFEIVIEEIEINGDDGELGKGTFGDVRRGIWRKEQVAIKFLKPEMTSSEENINAFIEECNMLKNLRHPNILLFMGASITPPYYFIVTEFCENGNLFELLHQHKEIPLNWEEKRRIALEVAFGMNYLHSFEPPILHRDLKSMNVLLDKNFQVKIADFGSTKFLEVQMTKQKGTFQWMAPEVIKGNSYTEKADVFSFGIIMNELASRQPPYLGVDKKEVARNVVHKPDYRPAVSRSYPREWIELMIRCWDHSANKRPNFNEIIDMLTKMRLSSK